VSAESVVPAGPKGLPRDYYERIYEVEERHWWHRGMREITAALLGDRLRRRDQSLLDAGCGTGGFLRWALDLGAFGRACGFDPSPAALALARARVPEAELTAAGLPDMPFESSSFDLVALNDVVQHVTEADVERSLVELRRVLRSGGALIVRTNGSRRARRERDDWRAYDRRLLESTLARGGFRCARLTYANTLPSLWAALRGRSPQAPTEKRHGIPALQSGALSAVCYGVLRAEAAYLRRSARSFPYGHTLFAVAIPR
jgi:SAM-dependent methyltransferase